MRELKLKELIANLIKDIAIDLAIESTNEASAIRANLKREDSSNKSKLA